MKYFAAVIIALAVSAAAAQQNADLVIVNADVRTMNDRQPTAQAIAIEGNKIIAVGQNAAIKRLAGPSTRVIDAGGRLVLPGFNDAHVHFAAIGNKFSSIDLRDAKTPDDLVSAVAHYARFLPKGRWILGGQWKTAIWTSDNGPHRGLVDAITPHNPVFLYNSDPSTAFVNSAALALAKIDKHTKAPAGGVIERDANGEPTGVLRGTALDIVRRLVPRDHERNWPEILETASNYAASLGITSVQDTHSDDLQAVYRELAAQGKLKTRVYDCIGLTAPAIDTSRTSEPKVTGEFRRNCLKSFADTDDEWMRRLQSEIIAADKAGQQIAIHAIGERPNEMLVDILERATKSNGPRGRRFRIEHAERANAETLRRYAAVSAIASVQPYLFNGGAGTGYYRSIIRAGVTLALGSDAPMTEFDPIRTIAAATSSNGGPQSGLSVHEAVYAHTVGSAYAEFQEKAKGKIGKSMLADLVIISENLFTADRLRMESAKALMTIMDGKVVYEDKTLLRQVR